MNKLQVLYIRGAWVLLDLKPQGGNNNDITTLVGNTYNLMKILARMKHRLTKRPSSRTLIKILTSGLLLLASLQIVQILTT